MEKKNSGGGEEMERERKEMQRKRAKVGEEC